MKSEFSKECIANALIKLLKIKKYESININDIVNEAGFSRMAYYRNFESKDDILKYYIKKSTNKWLIENNINYETITLFNYTLLLFDYFSKNKDFIKILSDQGILSIMKEESDKQFNKLAKNNKKEMYYYSFISGGFYNIFNMWVKTGMEESPEQMATFVFEYFSIKKLS